MRLWIHASAIMQSVAKARPVKPLVHGTKVLVQDFLSRDLLRQASAMAYVTLLSLIPSLVAVFCVISLFSPLVSGSQSLLNQIRQFVLSNLASGSGESVVRYLDNMLRDIDLAKIGWSSFASVLVTLILLLRQIEEALNSIWLIRRSRNILTRFMYFWSFLTLGLVVLGIFLGATSGFSLDQLWQSHGVTPPKSASGSLVGLAGATLFFFAIYKVVPNCKVKSGWALLGGFLAALALKEAGRFYGIYVRDAKNYQTLYGALAQLPLFLTWLYICWVVILLGALISWRLQEGFPTADEDDPYIAKTAIDHWRDVQIRGILPWVTLMAVYKAFSLGSGQGVSAQKLAHKLKLPMQWVVEAMETLVSLRYIIAAQGSSGDAGPSAVDPFFPRIPAEALPLQQIRHDFYQPLGEVLGHWQTEWPFDVQALSTILWGRQPVVGDTEVTHLSDVIPLLPEQLVNG